MTTIPDQPTPNHEADANTLMATIRELVQSRIPGFALAASGRRRKIASTASLEDAFFEAAAAACGVHDDLIAAGKVTPAELRNTVAFSRVYASLAEELRILARGVDDTVAEVRYEVGTRALMVYHVASRTNGPDERQLLIPHVAAMKRTLGRGRPATRKVVPPPVPPPPAPPTPPPPVPVTPPPPPADPNGPNGPNGPKK